MWLFLVYIEENYFLFIWTFAFKKWGVVFCCTLYGQQPHNTWILNILSILNLNTKHNTRALVVRIAKSCHTSWGETSSNYTPCLLLTILWTKTLKITASFFSASAWIHYFLMLGFFVVALGFFKFGFMMLRLNQELQMRNNLPPSYTPSSI